MTLSQLKAQVEALCRKYATELEALRLGRVAVEFCDEMSEALLKPRSGPPREHMDWTQALFRKMSDRGFRPRRLPAVEGYLKRCLNELRAFPQSSEVLRALLPRAAARGLVPRPPEDPVPLCAVKRAMQDSGDSGPPTLEGLVEYWLRTDYFRLLAEGPSQS